MTQAIATKAGIRYRYYLSLPCLHGAAKTAKIGSVTRVPATDIEDDVVKSLNEHLRSERGMQDSAITGHSAIAEVIDRIDVHRDRLEVHLRSRESPETTKPADDVQGPTGDCPLFIPWQKPPSKRFRQILLPHGSSRTEVRPERRTTPPSRQRDRTRQALAGRDSLRLRHCRGATLIRGCLRLFSGTLPYAR